MDRRFIVILLVIMVGFFGLFKLTSKDSDTASSGSSGKGSTNVFGKADSKVVLTEFVDFQCEACYSYFPLVKQLKEKYQDQLRFEVKYFPIEGGDHKFARQAARSAEAAARQGKFWEMHDQLFQGQKQWEQMPDPQTTFDGYAQSIGIDMAKFKTDRTSAEVNGVINADLDAVKKIGGSGTPTFVLNGKKVDKPGQTLDELSKLVEDALKAAGIKPAPRPVQETPAASTPTGSGSQAPSPGGQSPSSGGLAPGETAEQHAAESQQQR